MVIENLEEIGGTVIVVLDEIDAIGDDDYSIRGFTAIPP